MPWSMVIVCGIARNSKSPLQCVNNVLTGEQETRLQQHTLAAPFINDCEHSEFPSTQKLIVHEIHAPRLIRTGWHWCWTMMQTDPLASSIAHSDLEPLQAIKPVHTISASAPAFPTQQDMNPLIAEPWSTMRQLANPYA